MPYRIRPTPKVGEIVSVDAIQECRSVLADYVQLAKGAHVDDTDAVSYSLDLLDGITVGVGSLPLPDLSDLSASPHVSVVDGSHPEGHVPRPGYCAEGRRSEGRPGCRPAHGVEGAPRGLGDDLGVALVAHLPLAGPHRHGAVTLERLDVSEALVYGLPDVLLGHVFTYTYKFLGTGGLLAGDSSRDEE